MWLCGAGALWRSLFDSTLTFTVHTACAPAPHNHIHHYQCRTPYATVHTLVLLMMGIMMSETCCDKSLIINIRLVASCWFLSLHPKLCTTFLISVIRCRAWPDFCDTLYVDCDFFGNSQINRWRADIAVKDEKATRPRQVFPSCFKMKGTL